MLSMVDIAYRIEGPAAPASRSCVSMALLRGVESTNTPLWTYVTLRRPDTCHKTVVHCSGGELRKFTASDAIVRVPTTKALSSTKKPGLWFGAAFAGS